MSEHNAQYRINPTFPYSSIFKFGLKVSDKAKRKNYPRDSLYCHGDSFFFPRDNFLFIPHQLQFM